MYDCIAIGEILVDFISDRKNQAGFPILDGNPGGGPPNFIVAMAKLGMSTGLIAKVGNDMFGHQLIKCIADYEVDVSGVVVDDAHFTTLAFVSIDEHGERSFSFSRKHSADIMLASGELQRDMLEHTRALHFSSLSLIFEPSRSATYEAVRLARQQGAVIHFDPNYRDSLWRGAAVARDAIHRALAVCDIVKLSETELSLLTDVPVVLNPEHIVELARGLMTQHANLQLMHITLGEHGVVIICPDSYHYQPALNVTTVDTTGAGDAYGAAALYYYLTYCDRHSLATMLKPLSEFATRAAAHAVQSYGGIPSSATLTDLGIIHNH